MTPVGDNGHDAAQDLARFLGDHPPFESLDDDVLRRVAESARSVRMADGTEIIDAFVEPTQGLYVVVDGEVDLWTSVDLTDDRADERLTRGDVFGFSALLTQRSVGPRAVAVGATCLIVVPASAARRALASASGARFLAEYGQRTAASPSYATVEELIVNAPVVVAGSTPVGEVAEQMTRRGVGYAAVTLPAGGYGLLTDAVLRTSIVAAGRPTSTPVGQVMIESPPTTRLGQSAAEALIMLFDRDADFLLVTDQDGRLRGAVTPADFAVSPTTATVALRQQLVRARDVDELVTLARRTPEMVVELLSRGLVTSKVLAVYSATVDAVVRRALVLTFATHPELSLDAFTWLALGSNGRREAVLSSDIDSAVAFDDAVPADDRTAYRAVFAEVDGVLDRAGFSIDTHGATAARRMFSRTNSEWRAAAQQWLADPAADQGAMLTSLLVDGRPIHGDPGLPAVARVFGELRRHQGTMRLLLAESLSQRARLRSVRDVLARRGGTFDIKAHALTPVVNIARWAALSVGSSEVSTVERLRAAAGSEMLPDDDAGTLLEVVEALQRVRLRHQLAQRRRDVAPQDVVAMNALSPIDRSVLSQAVREVSAVQRRMANVAQFVPTEQWTSAPKR